MATWEDLLLEDMGRFISRKLDVEVEALYFDYQDADTSGHYHYSIGPDQAEVIIAWRGVDDDEFDPTNHYWFYGSLGELLDELRKNG